MSDKDNPAAFLGMYAVPPELDSRMSKLIWSDINDLHVSFGVRPDTILDEIKNLEEGDTRPTGVKKAAPFDRPPLKGLWHKHFFSPALSLAHNLDSWRMAGYALRAKSLLGIGEIANVLHGWIVAKDNDRELTGEWIIYLRHAGENYYLCCATHNAGEQFTYDRIMEHCDFPDLGAWLNGQQNS